MTPKTTKNHLFHVISLSNSNPLPPGLVSLFDEVLIFTSFQLIPASQVTKPHFFHLSAAVRAIAVMTFIILSVTETSDLSVPRPFSVSIFFRKFLSCMLETLVSIMQAWIFLKTVAQ